MTDAEAPLHRLLYRSRSAIAGSDEAVEAEIDSLLEASERNNAHENVTGALLFSSSVFLQALEGPRPAVEAAFERICRDAAHFDLEIIEYGAVDSRAFGRWSMRRLIADAPIERLLLQLGEGESAGAHQPDLAHEAIKLMATLVTLDQPEAGRAEQEAA